MNAVVRAATPDDLAAAPWIWPPLLAPPKRDRFLRGLAEGDVLVVVADGALAAYAWVYEYFFGHTFVAYLGVAEAAPPRPRRPAARRDRTARGDQRAFSSTNQSNTRMHAPSSATAGSAAARSTSTPATPS